MSSVVQKEQHGQLRPKGSLEDLGLNVRGLSAEAMQGGVCVCNACGRELILGF